MYGRGLGNNFQVGLLRILINNRPVKLRNCAQRPGELFSPNTGSKPLFRLHSMFWNSKFCVTSFRPWIPTLRGYRGESIGETGFRVSQN